MTWLFSFYLKEHHLSTSPKDVSVSIPKNQISWEGSGSICVRLVFFAPFLDLDMLFTNLSHCTCFSGSQMRGLFFVKCLCTVRAMCYVFRLTKQVCACPAQDMSVCGSASLCFVITLCAADLYPTHQLLLCQ